MPKTNNSNGLIIFGYDIENIAYSPHTFLHNVQQLHQRYEAPWTIYITGEILLRSYKDFLSVIPDPLLSICQHTYNHILLKSVYMQPNDGNLLYQNDFHKGGTLEQIEQEISDTQRLIKKVFNIDCEGLTAPYGYYRGLSDRPDILQILSDYGIKWVRSNSRDYRDCQPTPFSEQPFFYTDQGFPDILELGIQGYQDHFYWDRFDDRQFGNTYIDYLSAMLEKVSDENLVWNICAHDFNSEDDEQFSQNCGKWLEPFMSKAKELGVGFTSPSDLYAQMIAERKEVNVLTEDTKDFAVFTIPSPFTQQY